MTRLTLLLWVKENKIISHQFLDFKTREITEPQFNQCQMDLKLVIQRTTAVKLIWNITYPQLDFLKYKSCSPDNHLLNHQEYHQPTEKEVTKDHQWTQKVLMSMPARKQQYIEKQVIKKMLQPMFHQDHKSAGTKCM